ncbi:MAG: response regulator transcription factor [Aerococcus sp.]|nr:response regulator transcription factor [Aerococcus sp.]
MKIMIVEDDAVIRKQLCHALEKWQYETVVADDFSDVMKTFNEEQPALVLLDINLPIYNGYYWCTEIRKQSNVPIIFVSSRTEAMDIVMAMQMGGDDYIEKPLDLAVLTAKVQALLRRTYNYQQEQNEWTVSGVTLSLPQATLSYQGEQLSLTGTELKILEPLFRQAGQFVRREALIENCWLNDDYIDDNTLSVNMSRLRKKARQLGLEEWIETKKNIGYRVRKSDHE